MRSLRFSATPCRALPINLKLVVEEGKRTIISAYLREFRNPISAYVPAPSGKWGETASGRTSIPLGNLPWPNT